MAFYMSLLCISQVILCRRWLGLAILYPLLLGVELSGAYMLLLPDPQILGLSNVFDLASPFVDVSVDARGIRDGAL